MARARTSRSLRLLKERKAAVLSCSGAGVIICSQSPTPGGVSGALNEGSLCPTITSSDDNWLFRPIPDPACDGRPEPLLLSKPCLPGLRPTGSGQLDRLRPLWQTATPSAVLQDLQGSLLRTQGHAPVR